MQKHTFPLDETKFNVIWRALNDREEKLLNVIETGDEESDEVVYASNDIVYLRGLKRWLRDEALTSFDESVFNTSNDIIDC